jgi:hypothetical protein
MAAQNNSRLTEGLCSGEAGEPYHVGRVCDLAVAGVRAADNDDRFEAYWVVIATTDR